MKNLKRALSFALASVMVIGMMVVGAGAAFTDDAKIENDEAAAVMSALGVITGKPDGDALKFDPDAILTRAEAAKIITYMLLGEKKAEKLGTSGVNFTDVPAGHWAASYIGYCANMGIISGYNGEFNPTGELTGLAFGKMLLVALGYDAKVEGYTGTADWGINVAVDMIEAGIDLGDDAEVDAALTRDNAALMAYKTLLATLVKYDTKGTTITIGGVEIAAGAATAEAIPQGTTYENYKYEATEGLQFVEKYATNLKMVEGTDDAFGRPSAHKWEITKDNETTTVFNAVYAPFKTYVGTFNSTEKTALTDAEYTLPTTATYNKSGTIAVANLYDGTTAGKGYVVELFEITDDKEIDKIVVTEQNFATVEEVVLTEDKTMGTVTVSVRVYNETPAATTKEFTYTDTTAKTADIYDKLCGYAEDTALLLTMDWATEKPIAIAVPTAVTGKITKLDIGSLNVKSYVYVDGVAYPMANLFTTGKALTLNAEGTLYLDAAGYALGWVTKTAPAAKYAYVMDIEKKEAAMFETDDVYYAKLLLADGTVEIVATTEEGETKEGNLVSYKNGTGDDADKIVLTYVADEQAASAGVKANVAAQYNGIFNNKTTFVVETTNATTGKKVYTVYTGVANLPELTADKVVGVKATGTDNYKVFFVLGATKVNDPNTTKNVVYLLANDTLVKEYVSETKTLYYYNYKAIVNGEITTVKVAADAENSYAAKVAGGLFSDMTTNTDGFVTAATAKVDDNTNKVDVFTATGTEKAEEGVIELGNGAYIYDDATVVYKVASGAITKSSIGAVKVDANDTVIGYTTKGVLTMVVIATVANP